MSVLSVPKFTGHVTVIGDVMLDRYWAGPSSRISPEAPVPVVNISKAEDRPGGAANVALNISSLEAPCSLIGIIGKDEAGNKLRDFMRQRRIDTDFVECDNHPTITKLRVLSRNQQLLRLDFEEGFSGIDQEYLLNALRNTVSHTKAVIFSDYGKGALVSVQKMIGIANGAGVPVLIDPKGTDFDRYSHATLMTPNMSEFEAVAGKVRSEEDLVAKALKMIEDFDFKALVITRSEDGMSLIRKGHDPVHLPTRAREVYDVTGAGDTVIAAIATALASGIDFVTSCEIANRAAGIVVGKLGTSFATPRELQEDIENSGTDSYGIVDEDTLLQKVKELKDLKKRVIMTNGCFDILHRGHVDYLRRARALGDVLIVAVNTDDSVSRLKGPSRPIVPLDSRMYILEALGCVDYVVPFSEDTPERLIAKILPDILVKGGDYTVEQIAGHRQVIENGGDVITIPLVEGESTTGIIKKIQEDS